MVGEMWFQKGTGTWLVYYTDSQGTKRKKTLARGEHNREQAEAAYAALICQYGTVSQKAPTTVLDAANSYLAHQHNRLSTNRLKAVCKLLRQFAANFPGVPLVQVSRQQVLAWIDGLAGFSDGTKRTRIGMVQRFFNWCVEQEYLAVSPAAKIKRPAGDARGLEYAMTRGNLDKLLAGCPGWLQDVLNALFETGCRPGRLCEVRAEHYDPLTHSWRFSTEDNRGKKKVRYIVLSEAAKAIHDRLARVWPQGPIFRDHRGRPLDSSRISHYVRRVRRRLGLPEELIPYGGRHGFAVRTLENGFSRGEVASLLGHTSTKYVDEVYGHALETVPGLKAKLDNLPQVG